MYSSTGNDGEHDGNTALLAGVVSKMGKLAKEHNVTDRLSIHTPR